MLAGRTSDSMTVATCGISRSYSLFFTDLSVDERARTDVEGSSVFNCWISFVLVFSCMY